MFKAGLAVVESSSLFERKGCAFKAMTMLDGKKDEINKYRQGLVRII